MKNASSSSNLVSKKIFLIQWRHFKWCKLKYVLDVLNAFTNLFIVEIFSFIIVFYGWIAIHIARCRLMYRNSVYDAYVKYFASVKEAGIQIMKYELFLSAGILNILLSK